MKIFLFLSLQLCLLLSGCSGTAGPERNLASVLVEQPATEQGESWTDYDAIHADKIREIFAAKLLKDTGNNPLMKRDAHPKHHGCVKATMFLNNSKLKMDQRKGLFEKNAQYETWVRFSNGDPDSSKADIEADVRGMAVKVMGVPYDNYLSQARIEDKTPVHDFVMMNSPVFFLGNASDYVDFIKSAFGGGIRFLWYAVTHPSVIGILQKARNMKVYSPLDVDYHSATPYKLGDTSMKFKFKSCKDKKDEAPAKPSPDFLGERMEASLKEKERCFVFYVQPNMEPAKNNVEDSMKHWEEKGSPFVEVGILNIPRQSGVRTEERQSFCENITFNPWRSHVENRPMGAVNRVRLEVYSKQSQMRHDHNRETDPRPTKF